MVAGSYQGIQFSDTQPLVQIDEFDRGATLSQVTPGFAATRSTGLVIEADGGHKRILSR